MAVQRRSIKPVASLIVGVPLFGALMLGSDLLDPVWQPSPAHARAQEVPNTSANPLMPSPPAPDATDPRGIPPAVPVLRPVTETYLEEVTDPKTGKQVQIPRTVTRWVTEIPATESRSAAARSEQEQQLESQAAKIAAQLRRTEDQAEREKLTEQLQQVLHEAFAAQQQRWATQIEQLKSQLDRLEQQRAERGEREDAIVQRRLSQLTGGEDPYAWEPALATATPGATLQRMRPADAASTTTWPQPPGGFSLPSRGDESGDDPHRSADPASAAPAARDPLAAPTRGDGPIDSDSFGQDAPHGTAATSALSYVDGVRAAASGDVADLADRVIQAAAEYLKAGEALANYRQLGSRGAITRRALEQAERQAKVAEARLQLAQSAFANLKRQLEQLPQVAKHNEAAARAQLEHSLNLHKQGLGSALDVEVAKHATAKATTELRRAELALQAWQEAAETVAPMVERAARLRKELQELAERTPGTAAPPSTPPAAPDLGGQGPNTPEVRLEPAKEQFDASWHAALQEAEGLAVRISKADDAIFIQGKQDDVQRVIEAIRASEASPDADSKE